MPNALRSVDRQCRGRGRAARFDDAHRERVHSSVSVISNLHEQASLGKASQSDSSRNPRFKLGQLRRNDSAERREANFAECANRHERLLKMHIGPREGKYAGLRLNSLNERTRDPTEGSFRLGNS